MTAIVPLLFMWLWSQRNGTQRTATEPHWPTSASPPPQPPIPAFQSQHPSADTATPLADLHTSPPVAPHADAANAAKAAALHAVKSKLPKVPHIPGLSSGQAKSNHAVKDLQTILNRRGAGLVYDGKYGPKTAAAWANMARSANLPTYITRVGPGTAKVTTHTFDILSVPPIP